MITCDGEHCRIEGPVTMATVTAMVADGLQRFTAPSVTVDLSAVTDVDSSALSLMFEWRRAAQGAGRRIEFVNLPANLRSLAALYGVTELISAKP
jgi:phospholipid transport system transporter-binding protein